MTRRDVVARALVVALLVRRLPHTPPPRPLTRSIVRGCAFAPFRLRRWPG